MKENHSLKSVLKYVGLPRSSYYYRQTFYRRGRKPSELTKRKDGSLVQNSIVISDIKAIFDTEEFACYGYTPITHILKSDYTINRKKVYRLMKEENMLLERIKKPAKNKCYVKFKDLKNATLFSNLQMDIKYIYIQGERRNVYLLSIIDVYSKVNIGHLLSPTMKAKQTVGLIDYVFKAYNINPHRINISIRTDNGCQFIATVLREYLSKEGIMHEFTHLATPEENAYIESFHSILEKELVQRFEIDSLRQGKDLVFEYMEWYNFRRIHSSLGYKTPMSVLKEACNKDIVQNVSFLS